MFLSIHSAGDVFGFSGPQIVDGRLSLAALHRISKSLLYTHLIPLIGP
jgi:hypothetical protein